MYTSSFVLQVVHLHSFDIFSHSLVEHQSISIKSLFNCVYLNVSYNQLYIWNISSSSTKYSQNGSSSLTFFLFCALYFLSKLCKVQRRSAADAANTSCGCFTQSLVYRVPFWLNSTSLMLSSSVGLYCSSSVAKFPNSFASDVLIIFAFFLTW